MNLHYQSCSSGSDAVSTPVLVADRGQARHAVWQPYTSTGPTSQASMGRKGVCLCYSPHFALAPRSLSPMPEQSRAPRRRAIAVAPPCSLAAVAAPLLDSLFQQLQHLYLYLSEPLLPHVTPW